MAEKKKFHKIQLRVETEPLAETERQQKRAALERRFPDGLAEIELRMERIPDSAIRIDNPRPEDRIRPVGLTSMPVPVNVYKGTSPATGLPIYDPQVKMVIHAEPAPGRAEGPIPRTLRTDSIPGLSPYMDKWDVLEFYLEHPLCGIDFTVKPIDRMLDEKLRTEAKKPGARAVMKRIVQQGAILEAAKAGPPKGAAKANAAKGKAGRGGPLDGSRTEDDDPLADILQQAEEDLTDSYVGDSYVEEDSLVEDEDLVGA